MLPLIVDLHLTFLQTKDKNCFYFSIHKAQIYIHICMNKRPIFNVYVSSGKSFVYLFISMCVEMFMWVDTYVKVYFFGSDNYMKTQVYVVRDV